MAQPYPAWMFPTAVSMAEQENAMWITVLSPYYQTIRADRVESVRVAYNHGVHAPGERYKLIAVIEERDYAVSLHSNQLDAENAAKELQIVLENS